jgi:hypothetical protein
VRGAGHIEAWVKNMVKWRLSPRRWGGSGGAAKFWRTLQLSFTEAIETSLRQGAAATQRCFGGHLVVRGKNGGGGTRYPFHVSTQCDRKREGGKLAGGSGRGAGDET